MKLTKTELKDFLDTKVELYNNPKFIESDPVQIPRLFSKKEDIEIIGFLTATIAWGNRKSIITNAKHMVNLLDQAPFEFIMQHQDTDLEKLLPFVHRTFNGYDFIQFVTSLKQIYTKHNGLEAVFAKHVGGYNSAPAHNAIDAYIKDFNLATRGYIWEVYQYNPMVDTDSTKWETYIYYPLK